MAILNSLDLLAKKTLVQVNEINAKLTVPNASGATIKIDASDHKEIDTAILSLINDLIESSYNRLDGILLSDIITGIDGNILQWEGVTNSWITVDPSFINEAAGTTYDIQFNNNDTFAASSNFTYDFNLNNFKVLDSSSTFKLPITGSKNFVISQDNSLVNNLFEVNSDKSINIGEINSTIALRRGLTNLDESLVFSENLLKLNNANLEIKSASSLIGDAFKLLNNSNQNLRTVNNKGEESKNIALLGERINKAISNQLNYTLDSSSGPERREVIGEHLALNVTIIDTSLALKIGKKITVTTAGAGSVASNYYSVASWNEVSGTSGVAGYFNNALLVGSDPVYYNQSVDDPRGYVGLVANGVETGLDINYEPVFGGMQTLLRLRRNSPNPQINMLPVNAGIQILFSNLIDARQDFPNPGANYTSANDYLGVRVKDVTLLAATTEMFFKTTQSGDSVEPLTLNGKDVNVGILNSIIKIRQPYVFADNAAALIGGLPIDAIYRTSTGELRQVI